MTNLIFSIVVAVVTNVSEQVTPARDSGIVLTSNPPQYQMLPASKIVTTTVSRVTNFISDVWVELDYNGRGNVAVANGPRPNLVFEAGRVTLSQSVEHFTEAVERRWVKDTNALSFIWSSPFNWSAR